MSRPGSRCYIISLSIDASRKKIPLHGDPACSLMFNAFTILLASTSKGQSQQLNWASCLLLQGQKIQGFFVGKACVHMFTMGKVPSGINLYVLCIGARNPPRLARTAVKNTLNPCVDSQVTGFPAKRGDFLACLSSPSPCKGPSL